MKNKQISIEQVSSQLKDGMTIMVGGFLGVGTPEKLVRSILDKEIKDIKLIANDTAFKEKGVGKLIVNHQVSKVIASYIGSNPETIRQFYDDEMDIELVPQGTLAERIHCGGAGLGGILTPTGVGTIVEKNKKKMNINGVEYLLETALHADIALIKAKKSDRFGNLIYDKLARNFNPVMALAADLVIAEVDEIVENGEFDPDEVITPGIVIDQIFCTGGD